MKRVAFFMMAALMLAMGAQAKKMSDLKIYINPGHGGYTSNDRPIHIYPFEANDTLGYWESKSNLYKGLHMYHILDSLGAKAYLSRTKNTENDDRSLSGISAEANSLGCDLFFSIHSNAGEQVNYPLMLYRENTIGTARYPENITLSKILWKNLHSSKLAVWTRNTEYVCGDLTFYQNMWQGGLGVLRNLYVVGLLSEGQMHEHRPEAHRLMNDDYWWLEAWHFVRSIMEYYGWEDKFVTGNVAGVVYDDHNLREKYQPVTFHFFGRDAYAPLNGATVELLDMEGNVVQKRTTDQMYNGVFVFRNVEPGNYRLRAVRDDYHEEISDVTVVANEVTYNDMPLQLKRNFPLEITSHTPNVAADEAVSCASTIDFTFNTDVDTEAFEEAFSIEPAVDGYFVYSDTYTKASFVPSLALERDTHYKVTVSTQARHTDTYCEARNLQAPYEFEFTTKGRNRLEMIDAFPAPGGVVHYVTPQFEFRFDALIDYSNVYDLIRVTDAQGQLVAINKRTSKFNQLSNGYGNAVFSVSGNLQEGATYHVCLSGQLRDRESLPLETDAEFDFTAINAAVEHGGTVVDDFESTAAFDYDKEQTTGIGTTLPKCILSTAAKLYGSSSAKFTYKFIDNHGGSIVWLYGGDTHIVGEGDVIGAYVYGDFNNHELYVSVASGPDVKWFKLCDLNFLGWQYFEVPVTGLTDGMTYSFAGVRLDQVNSPITQNGTFCLDNLSVRATEGGVGSVMADESGINVSLVGDVVTVVAPEPIVTIEAIDAAGHAVVASAQYSDRLDVAALPAGVYMLRVITDEGRVRVAKLSLNR